MMRMVKKRQGSVKSPKPLSDEDVGRFLKHLAGSLKDRRTGNPLLAEALLRVVATLAGNREGLLIEGDHRETEKNPELQFQSLTTPLANLSSDQIRKYIGDDSKTKPELIDLATARFSIPAARLNRMTTRQLRDAIWSALTHETSLAIITEEAARYGSRRQS